MAEAAVETRPPNRFFCHQCSVEISPNLPDFTCPRCQSGFIEEMNEDLAVEGSPQPQPVPTDPAAHFADLFGRSFLQSFHNHIDPTQPITVDSDTDTDDDGDLANTPGPPGSHPNIQPRPFPGLFTTMPGARISIRTRTAGQDGGPAANTDHSNQALQSLLQSLISGLIGGGIQGGNQGITLPFGGMLSMHGNPGDYAWGTGGLDNIITQLLNQIEGTGPPPANKDDIDQLDEIVISKDQTDKGQQCSVCMEDFVLDESVKGLPCQHIYHKDCIIPWLELHGTCPVCRKPVAGGANCDAQNSHQVPVNDNLPHDPNSSHGNSSERSSSSSQGSSSSATSRNQNPNSYLMFEEEYD